MNILTSSNLAPVTVPATRRTAPEIAQPKASADSYSPGLLERGAGAAGAVVGGLVGGAAMALPAGLAASMVRNRDREDLQGTMHVLASAGAIALAGGVAHLNGMHAMAGAAIGAGLVIAVTFLHKTSGGADALGVAVDKKVGKALHNLPVDGTKSLARAATTAGIVGLTQGAVQGGTVGSLEGRGVALGLLEGVSDGARALVGTHLSAGEGETSHGFLGHLVRLPKYALQLGAGLVGGVAGAAASLLCGAYQGAEMALNDTRYFGGDTDRENRLFLQGVQYCVALPALGLAVGGPALAVAAVVPALLATAVTGIAESGGRGDAVAESVNQAMDRARANNRSTGSSVTDRVRDTVEGFMVGAAAGVSGGFLNGFQGGAALVQSGCDVLSGIALGAQGRVNSRA